MRVTAVSKWARCERFDHPAGGPCRPWRCWRRAPRRSPRWPERPKHDEKAEFFRLCDLAVIELSKEITPFLGHSDKDPKTHHVPFFEDSYAVRAGGGLRHDGQERVPRSVPALV